jgi:hypothetical protein
MERGKADTISFSYFVKFGVEGLAGDEITDILLDGVRRKVRKGGQSSVRPSVDLTDMSIS